MHCDPVVRMQVTGNRGPLISLSWSQVYDVHQEESIMSKGQDSKKNVKKKALLTPKEKKAAKLAKKNAAKNKGITDLQITV